jgi:hypothetical protein
VKVPNDSSAPYRKANPGFVDAKLRATRGPPRPSINVVQADWPQAQEVTLDDTWFGLHFAVPNEYCPTTRTGAASSRSAETARGPRSPTSRRTVP